MSDDRGNRIHDEELRRRYLADQVETATPATRLLMLFDRLQRDLADAATAFETRDIPAINAALQHAQQIVMALRDPLDGSSELGRSLASLYSYCLDRLVEANLTKDPKSLARVTSMLGAVASANRSAAAELIADGPAASFEGVA